MGIITQSKISRQLPIEDFETRNDHLEKTCYQRGAWPVCPYLSLWDGFRYKAFVFWESCQCSHQGSYHPEVLQVSYQDVCLDQTSGILTSVQFFTFSLRMWVLLGLDVHHWELCELSCHVLTVQLLCFLLGPLARLSFWLCVLGVCFQLIVCLLFQHQKVANVVSEESYL